MLFAWNDEDPQWSLDHNIKVFLTDPPLSNTLHSVFDDLLNLWNFNIPKISDASKLEIFLYKNVPIDNMTNKIQVNSSTFSESYINSH